MNLRAKWLLIKVHILLFKSAIMLEDSNSGTYVYKKPQ